jgi:hypothetical protein
MVLGVIGPDITGLPAFWLSIRGVKKGVKSFQIHVLRSCLVLASAAFFAAPAHANMVRQIIIGKCSTAMQDDFKKAGKTPPAGLVGETCGCIADGMLRRRQSLDQAKAVCVKQSTAKFNL